MPGREQQRFAAELTLTLDEGYGRVRNVSASGVYFVTDVALREGQPVKFTLEFQNFPSGPISMKCTGRVVRVEEQEGKRGVAVAIRSFEFRRSTGAGGKLRNNKGATKE